MIRPPGIDRRIWQQLTALATYAMMKVMDRRAFIRLFAAVTGSGVLAPLLSRCTPDDTAVQLEEAATASPPPPTVSASPTYLESTARAAAPDEPPTATATTGPQPSSTRHATATPDPGLATVALVQTTDRAGGVDRALALLDSNPVQGKRVLLKPNFNSADAAPGSTHPELLRALIRQLQKMGASAITVADRSGMGDTRQVMAQKGIFDLASELGFDVVVLEELPESEWSLYRPADSHWVDGFPIPRLLLEAECVVQTCNLKTHRYGGHFTIVPQKFGWLCGQVCRERRLQLHARITQLRLPAADDCGD